MAEPVAGTIDAGAARRWRQRSPGRARRVGKWAGLARARVRVFLIRERLEKIRAFLLHCSEAAPLLGF